MLSRVERFAVAGSTNDVVREWLLDGTPEVCLAVADVQTAGRGRHRREWTAPAGTALLVSLGFRPGWIAPGRAWRIGATVALAMADAAEDTAGLPVGTIRLKWPNDLVVETAGPRALLPAGLPADEAVATLAAPLALRKLAGVLGETDGLGTDDPRMIVGIGINADWARADFPADLAPGMTSLREASGNRPIDREALLDAFLDRLQGRLHALRAGWFDMATWADRQATTGRLVALESGNGAAAVPQRALGVDGATGALVVGDDAAPSGERLVHAGEVVKVGLAPAPADTGTRPRTPGRV
jgi:BirA family biotin operon repressor/biotin-[acetyl-CoA-carboxylase] ligase